ncbi:MAG: inositol monophosphatase [Bryobacteraceae bacterium]|nr:inositol monophosphatase [Bryobacteraceae bacterium]
MAWERELETALELVRAAASTALGYWRQGVPASDKTDGSPVTAADQECERLIAGRLAELFPADGILGEEGSTRPAGSGRRWIIDPIDGTRDFLRGSFLWCHLLALEADGEVVLGVAHFPAQGRLYHAVRGQGAWCVEGRTETQLRCSDIAEPGRAVVCFGLLDQAHRYGWGERLLPFLSRFWAVRALGGATDAMLVASGRADAYLEPGLKPWDVAALSIIAREAGCVFHDFEGRGTIYGGSAAIYAPGLAPAVRAFLGLPV